MKALPRTRTGLEIAALMAEYRIRPNHLRGQNFLVDDQMYDDIIATAHLSKNDHVLEVGPGLGTLTERLAAAAGRVTAVEVDQKLVRVLERRFQRTKNVTIRTGNVLAKPVAAYGVMPPYRIVSNIPYYLTGNFFRKFLSDDVRPQEMTVLVQKEVAERIVAKPGRMSLLALSVQLYAKPIIVRTVPRTSFVPAPEVESALLHLSDIHDFPYGDITEKFFWRVAHVGFASPRKQLVNTISAGFHNLSREALNNIFSQAGVRPESRAQELTLENWHSLATFLGRGLTP